MQNGETSDAKEVCVVVPYCGGHAWERVEPTCKEDERGRTGGCGWGAGGKKGDTALGEGLEDDLTRGFIFEGSVDELCRAHG